MNNTFKCNIFHTVHYNVLPKFNCGILFIQKNHKYTL